MKGKAGQPGPNECLFMSISFYRWLFLCWFFRWQETARQAVQGHSHPRLQVGHDIATGQHRDQYKNHQPQYFHNCSLLLPYYIRSGNLGGHLFPGNTPDGFECIEPPPSNRFQFTGWPAKHQWRIGPYRHQAAAGL